MGSENLKEKRNTIKLTTVILVQPKLLKDVIMELEGKQKISLFSLVKQGKVAVLVNGKTTTNLMRELKPGDEVVALPVLRG